MKKIIICIVVFIGISIIGLIGLVVIGVAVNEAVAEDQKNEKVTLENFKKVKMTMAYDQVKNILGEGEEISRTKMYKTTMAMYSWSSGYLGASCNITFENGEVINKSQFGLR